MVGGRIIYSPQDGWDFLLRNKLENVIVHTVTQMTNS